MPTQVHDSAQRWPDLHPLVTAHVQCMNVGHFSLHVPMSFEAFYCTCVTDASEPLSYPASLSAFPSTTLCRPSEKGSIFRFIDCFIECNSFANPGAWFPAAPEPVFVCILLGGGLEPGGTLLNDMYLSTASARLSRTQTWQAGCRLVRAVVGI